MTINISNSPILIAGETGTINGFAKTRTAEEKAPQSTNQKKLLKETIYKP